MAVASRSIRTSGYSFKGIIFTIIGILVIIALFFIPEIIQFQRSISGISTSVGAMKTLQTAAVSIPKDPKDSQLNRIASLIDSGYLEKLGNTDAKKVASDSAAVPVTETKTDASSAVKSADKKESGASWKAIKSRESKSALRKAHDEMLNILRTLPTDRRGSRFALLNFANGLEQLVDGNNEKTLAASDAIRQLETLYSACIKEFINEGVSQIAYKRFVGIDFGPTISTWSLKLSGQLVPFNPQLTLTQLSISQRKASDTSAPVIVSFEGYIVGDDVERIEMVCGGIRFDDLLPKKVDASGYRKFKSKRFDLTGKVLLKVYDRRGRVYQKLYSFYPRARIFETRKGRFIIPKTASEYDNRLDRFFTYQVSREDTTTDAFLVNQGFERF